MGASEPNWSLTGSAGTVGATAFGPAVGRRNRMVSVPGRAMIRGECRREWLVCKQASEQECRSPKVGRDCPRKRTRASDPKPKSHQRSIYPFFIHQAMWPFSSSVTSEAGPSALPDLTAPVESPAKSVQETTEPPSLSRWEDTLQSEERYQAKIYETVEDVPGCMQLV
jgi:hypothetical protein